MITIKQIQESMKIQGLEAPFFMLEGIAEQVNSISDCLDQNYSKPTALMIQSHLATLMLLAQTGRQISSQSAPSGASRSFKYADLSSLWKGQLGLLKSLDVNGCVNGLIPKSPIDKPKGFIFSARGGCYERNR